MKLRLDTVPPLGVDWLVAFCEGKVEQGVYGTPVVLDGELHLNYCDAILQHKFSPTRDWSIIGPIIDRELIQVTPICQDNPKYGWVGAYKSRGEFGDEDMYSTHRQRGRTASIAACRAYVCSKLGSHVDVPEEFLP